MPVAAGCRESGPASDDVTRRFTGDLVYLGVGLRSVRCSGSVQGLRAVRQSGSGQTEFCIIAPLVARQVRQKREAPCLVPPNCAPPTRHMSVEAHQQSEVDDNLRAVRALADQMASEMGVTVTATIVADDADVPPGCKKVSSLRPRARGRGRHGSPAHHPPLRQVHFIRHGEGHHNVVQREWRARADWDGARQPPRCDPACLGCNPARTHAATLRTQARASRTRSTPTPHTGSATRCSPRKARPRRGLSRRVAQPAAATPKSQPQPKPLPDSGV